MSRYTRECLDPSQINDKVHVASYAMGDEEDVIRANTIAKADPDGWRKKTYAERHEILSKAAMELRHARGDLIGAAAANTGKVFTSLLYQTDKEVIEIIPEIQRIRYAGTDRVSPNVFEAAAKTGFYIARTPVMMEGRIELLQYFQQQAVCDSYHRYGNLGERTII